MNDQMDLGAFSRRRFVSMLGAGTASLTIAPLLSLYARRVQAAPAFGEGFGPLSPKLPLNTDELITPEIGDLRNQPILALPDGFEYRVISCHGQSMDDGHRVSGAHDGMAAFRGPRATTILVRNHELSSSGIAVGGPAVYDRTRRGGTTTLVLDNQGKLIRHYGSIAGTVRNCAGGPTPWGSWLTCEETFSEGDTGLRHGYVFEVPADGYGNIAPLTGMGRFSHEATATDPATGVVYLTEDRGDSAFYRYRPNVPGHLHAGGVLEALRLKDFPGGVGTGSGFRPYLQQPLAVEWVVIDEPDPDTEGGGNSTRAQAQAKGAAVFVRGEGAWYGNGKIYFVSTSGGDDRGGQVFAYDPADETLTLFVEAVRDSADPALADNNGFIVAAPDNVAVGPDGRLYLCEDGSGVEKVVGVDLNGDLYEAARNVIGGDMGNGSEFAGVCFSHDGRFMFVNIQSPGLTCVIRGPWRKGQRG